MLLVEPTRKDCRMVRVDKDAKRETLAYINAMSQELRTLAQDADADGLSYLLGMVIYEARKAERAIERPPSEDRLRAIDIQRLYMSEALDK